MEGSVLVKRPQIQKFRDKARELGADIGADDFDAALRKISKSNPDPKDIEKLADKIGQSDPNKNFGRKRKD